MITQFQPYVKPTSNNNSQSNIKKDLKELDNKLMMLEDIIVAQKKK